MADEVSRAAYHEAGHAVVARSLHQAVSKVTIVPTESYLGHVSLPIPKWVREFGGGEGKALLWAIKHAMVLVAGYETERQKFGSKDTDWVESSDFRHAMATCNSVTSGPEESETLLDWVQARTAAHIRMPLERLQIEFLVCALGEKKTLSAREVRELCGLALRVWMENKGCWEGFPKGTIHYDEKTRVWSFEKEAQNANVQDHE